MKAKKDNHQLDDEFEPIELGSVSDETKGGPDNALESFVIPNSYFV